MEKKRESTTKFLNQKYHLHFLVWVIKLANRNHIKIIHSTPKGKVFDYLSNQPLMVKDFNSLPFYYRKGLKKLPFVINCVGIAMLL